MQRCMKSFCHDHLSFQPRHLHLRRLRDCAAVDGVKAYFGSANLTGAGMGAKSEKKRNFENGVLTDDPALVEPLVEQFDSVWRGAFCRDCGRSALGFASAIPSRCSALTSFGGYATSATILWYRLSG